MKGLLKIIFEHNIFISEPIFKFFAVLFRTFGMQECKRMTGSSSLAVFQKFVILKRTVSERWYMDSRSSSYKF